MSLVQTLSNARHLLDAMGWSEGPFAGPKVNVTNALYLSTPDGVMAARAFELLESFIAPATAGLNAITYAVVAGGGDSLTDTDVASVARASVREPSLFEWLEKKGRTQAEVLRLFDAALLRAKALEGE